MSSPGGSSSSESGLDQVVELCNKGLNGTVTFNIHTCLAEPIPLSYQTLDNVKIKQFITDLSLKLNQALLSSTTTNQQQQDSNTTNTSEFYLKNININQIDSDENVSEFLLESLLKIEQTCLNSQVFHMDHPSNNNSGLELPIHILNEKTSTILHSISTFIEDENQKNFLFSSNFSTTDRKFIHAISSLYGIYHKSEGSSSNRVIKISKDELTGGGGKTGGGRKKREPNFPSGMSTIIDQVLFLGSGMDANDEIQLTKNGVEYILNVTQEWPLGKHVPSHIKFKRIALKDEREQDILNYLQEGIDFINSALNEKKKILVHCVIGKSRSASFVIAFIMFHLKYNLKQAFEYVKERRDLIRPNDGFIKQLMLFENKLYDGQFTDSETKLSTSLIWEFGETKQEKIKREKEERKSKLSEQDEKEIDEFLLTVLPSLLEECFSSSSVVELEYSKKDTPKFIKFVQEHNSIQSHPFGKNVNFAKHVHNSVAKWFITKSSFEK